MIPLLPKQRGRSNSWGEEEGVTWKGDRGRAKQFSGAATAEEEEEEEVGTPLMTDLCRRKKILPVNESDLLLQKLLSVSF